MKQNLSELHFTGGILSPPAKSAECTLHMRPRSSTMCSDAASGGGTGGGNSGNGASKQRDNLTNLQLSPVQKHKSTVSSLRAYSLSLSLENLTNFLSLSL